MANCKKILIAPLILMLFMFTGCKSESVLKNVNSVVESITPNDECEEIISMVLEQQYRYNNKPVAKAAENSVILQRDALIGSAPYILPQQNVLYLSDKKLLYHRLEMDLRFFTEYGYIDYADLKKIVDKLTDLQEKCTYTIQKTDLNKFSDADFFKNAGFKNVYLVTLHYPNIKTIHKRIIRNIKEELQQEFQVYAQDRKDFERIANDEKTSASELQKYGEVILKNYLQVLDDPNIPFKTLKKPVYMKKQETEKYTMYLVADAKSSDFFMHASEIMWSGCMESVYEYASDVSSMVLFNKQFSINFAKLSLPEKINDSETKSKLNKYVEEFNSNGMNHTQNIGNLEELDAYFSRLDELNDKILPMMFNLMRSVQWIYVCDNTKGDKIYLDVSSIVGNQESFSAKIKIFDQATNITFANTAAGLYGSFENEQRYLVNQNPILTKIYNACLKYLR